MKQREKQILFVMFLVILVVQAFADTVPIYVASKSAQTSYNYIFNFTSNSACTAVLFMNKTSILTDSTGIGAANVGIAGMKTPPAFICEFIGHTLRKAHPVESGIFENLFIRRNFTVMAGPFNASRILAIINSTAINSTVTTLITNNVTINSGVAALRASNVTVNKKILVANFTNVTTYSTAGTYTWTKPVSKGADTVLIEVWGAGGSGGCGGSADAGGGGGGGGYVSVVLPLSELGATETCVVGTGGITASGCGSFDRDGKAGGNTSFANITAYGGGAGCGSTTADCGGGGGGDVVGVGSMGTAVPAGGTCGGASGGCFGMFGGTGGAGATIGEAGTKSIFGGAGGGGGGSTSGGAGGNSTFGGAGGGGGGGVSGAAPGGFSMYGGNGGAGTTAGSGAGVGIVPGGGGGGSEQGQGGNGGDGQCRITVW